MTEKQFILKVENSKKIIIYGAGMVGNLVYSRLVSKGLKKYIIGFAVSFQNTENHSDVPIYEVSELLKYKESANVIIATLPNLHTEILNILYQYGFKNIWKVTEKLYQDMSENYIEEYRKMHNFTRTSTDILLMASDNNSSSGAFLCLADLSVELSKHGITNVILLPEYGNGEGVLLSKNIDFMYISSRSWTKKLNKNSCALKDLEIEQEVNIKAVLEIESFIVQHQVKLVHNNTSYTYVGAVAAKNKNIPFVWHIRENIYEQGFEFIDYGKSIEFINQSAKIIAVSNFISTSYRKLKLDKIQVCYDGVNIEDYYDEKKSLFNHKKVIISQIGVITPAKNQIDLIKVALILKKKHIDFLIRFIGNGDKEYIDSLRDMIKNFQLEENIIFMGRREDIFTFYQEADIVTVCSRAEPFGRTTVEAQLSGCLVIGADVGATPELIEDGKTGFLYKHGDIENFAEKIVYALTEPEISRKIAANGQRHAYRFYTKERNAKEIINLYEEILSE